MEAEYAYFREQIVSPPVLLFWDKDGRPFKSFSQLFMLTPLCLSSLVKTIPKVMFVWSYSDSRQCVPALLSSTEQINSDTRPRLFSRKQEIHSSHLCKGHAASRPHTNVAGSDKLLSKHTRTRTKKKSRIIIPDMELEPLSRSRTTKSFC